MAYHNIDVHSEIFTPDEFPVEILETAKRTDVISCCLSPAAKQFFIFMLFQEYKYKSNGISIYVQNHPIEEEEEEEIVQENVKPEVPLEDGDEEDEDDQSSPKEEKTKELTQKEKERNLSCLTLLKTLSNIPIIYHKPEDDDEINPQNYPHPCVIVCTSSNVSKLITSPLQNLIKLIVAENVQEALVNREFQAELLSLLTLTRALNQSKEKPDQIRTVLLSVSLLQFYGNESGGFWRMKESFERMEKLFKVKVDTTSDIVAILKYTPLPTERIIQFSPGEMSPEAHKLCLDVQTCIGDLRLFLERHTFNPADMFGDLPMITDKENTDDEALAYAQELAGIPNPTIEPLNIISRFLSILEQFGPWAANRAIVLFSITVERLKVRTPYERHYLLLGLVQTRLILLQTMIENSFKNYEPELILQKFSSSKLLALLSILRRFDLKTQMDPPRQRHLSATEVNPDDFFDEEEESFTPAVQPLPQRSSRGARRRQQGNRKRQNSSENKVEPILHSSVAEKQEKEAAAKVIVPPPRNKRHAKVNKYEENPLCALVLLEDRFEARLIFHFLKEASTIDPLLIGLNPTIAVCANPDFPKDSKEAEMAYKKKEECLRKFRYREANLLVGTTLLEDGIELPKANLVIRFDASKTFKSYVHARGKAQAPEAEYFIFTESNNLPSTLEQLATYKLTEEILLSHIIVPKSNAVVEYTKEENFWLNTMPHFYTANLSNAISIVNRYCARLPSDTFTRLTPQWSFTVTDPPLEEALPGLDVPWKKMYTCTLRLPINSPVKWPIKGLPMSNQKLAKRVVALQTVIVLHKNHEIDDQLLPVGKEGVSQEPDISIPSCEPDDGNELGDYRPGSTKRRQYYDKRIAPELTKCLPQPGKNFYLYWVNLVLTCPIPEEQNTRGRKIYPPEQASQWFGLLLDKELPQVPPFPIYTRCGEVHVQIIRINEGSVESMNESQLAKISAFHHYTFTSVLRLDKYLTLFEPDASESSFYILPLRPIAEEPRAAIDWDFIEVIWKSRESLRPQALSDAERSGFQFNSQDYSDAVVMPWYRNNDTPQYFYVAEICESLTPQSQFPGCEFKTFEEYYLKKYNINIQNSTQPLLDVDHTSARLNFLTPRYVNRKGMMLPTSSENTKKAKRENLEQKQILVPELCAIHPFRASLWRQAVALPCILYRINILLLANDIRSTVALQIHGLGQPTLKREIMWDPLNFGWNLSDIVQISAKKLKESEEEKAKVEGKSNEEDSNTDKASEKVQEPEKAEKEASKDKPDVNSTSENGGGDAKGEEVSGFEKAAKEETPIGISIGETLLSNDTFKGKSANEILSEKLKTCRQLELEIGTWSNDMFMPSENGESKPSPKSEEPENEFDEDEDELEDAMMNPNVALPCNLTMLDKNWAWGGRSRLFNHKVHRALYGSPTHWGDVWDADAFKPIDDIEEANPLDADENGDNASIASDLSHSSTGSFLDEDNNLKIQFHGGNTAEALDKRKFTYFDHRPEDAFIPEEAEWWVEEDHGREVELEVEFAEQAKIKAQEIEGIIPWDSIGALPERKSGGKGGAIEEKAPVINDEAALMENPYYQKFLEACDPPPILPESPSFKRNVEVEANQGGFSFDYQPSLSLHPGPNPCQILQALTMSGANDGVNLERLETIGDSFLKYAITAYLFCTYENIHEGKLSHLRSKQVSNVHLYRMGRKRGLGGLMVSAKFEPHDNWLPPCYHIPKDLDRALISSKVTPGMFSMAQVKALKDLPQKEIEAALKDRQLTKPDSEFVPYNLVTQQSIPDKSIADCVEALIGAYLTSTGPHGALLFMSWLGMRVLPMEIVSRSKIQAQIEENRDEEFFYMDVKGDSENVHLFKKLPPPRSPLLRYYPDCESRLESLLKGYEEFENHICYKFRDPSYLLQAFTHASYSSNALTDCYQRLEFLGDAILDYLITRHLYEDSRMHSPGSLTDLRSALVNNTIFASLAVKNSFHKYFRHASPGLSSVLQKFVAFQEQHGNTLTQDYYLMGEDEAEEAEDIEVPKALGDVFESVAGAIYLDSGMSLDAVWSVYYRIMKNEIEQFSENVPKSPIRELLELEPETAKFGRPEKLMDGRRVRVSVEIFGVGIFKGIGRNYRIAKCTAARIALKVVKKLRKVN